MASESSGKRRRFTADEVIAEIFRDDDSHDEELDSSDDYVPSHSSAESSDDADQRDESESRSIVSIYP